MKVTRRDLLVWGAGAAAGLLATPVPWKILDDTSIWSQNWPWIPQPLKVPVEIKQSGCTLCPKGCGVRVGMAAGWPVGIAGLSTHPISRGALCPLAFAAHQLNWHPQRLRSVRHLASDSSWPQAQAAFAQACKEGPVIIIDAYPGRASSSLFETFAEKYSGSYRTVASAELRALATLRSMERSSCEFSRIRSRTCDNDRQLWRATTRRLGNAGPFHSALGGTCGWNERSPTPVDSNRQFALANCCPSLAVDPDSGRRRIGISLGIGSRAG